MKIIKSELASKLSSISAALDKDITDSTQLITALKKYENLSQNELEGKTYTEIFKKIQGYISMVEKRKEIGSNLKGKIDSAKTTMINYIGTTESSLDTSLLDEIRQQYNLAVQNYNNAKYEYDNAVSIAQAEIKEMKSRGENVISSAGAILSDTINFENQMNEYSLLKQNSLKLIEKLEGLEAKDNETYATFESVATQIANYKASIGNIQETNFTESTETTIQEA